MASTYVPRISQLDSVFLNTEVNSLIKSQLLSGVKYSGGTLLTKLEPEIDAALHYVILKYTVGKFRSSIGQQLLQIKYKDQTSHHKLHNYILLMVLARWLKERFGLIVTKLTNSDHIKTLTGRCVNTLELLYKIVETVNLVVFLYFGCYPTVLERVFSLSHVPCDPSTSRRISYTYFTRELLWHGFAELLAFILPLINLQDFHTTMKKFLPSVSGDDNKSEDVTTRFDVATTCVLCNQPPIIPHTLGCQHLACYYCVHSNYGCDPTFSCSLCGHQVNNKANIVPVNVS